MDLDAIKSLLEDFDLAAFLPKLEDVMGWVEMLLRIAVMIGPLLLLGFGLLYLLAPPKEANYGLGYRFWWGMASLDAWQFTQKAAGIAWTALGTVLTVVMAVLCNAFRRMEPMDMVWSAVKCLLWQLGLAVLACIAVDVLVIVMFDRRGFRRREKE